MRNKLILVAGLLVIVGSAVALVASGHGEVRYSADHDATIPIWHRWVPALAGIALVRLIPPRSSHVDVPEKPWTLWILSLAAALFAIGLRLAGGGGPAYSVLKLFLLLLVPAVVFWVGREALTVSSSAGVRPLVPVLVWFVLTYATPLAVPVEEPAADSSVGMLVAVIVVGFAVNSLLEEVFYRRWLQTRFETRLGMWPGIVVASLLWAVWHIGIQGTGSLPLDLASVIASHGVQGLFLGYLWSRYRRMWPILIVHGALNAATLLIPLIGHSG